MAQISVEANSTQEELEQVVRLNSPVLTSTIRQFLKSENSTEIKQRQASRVMLRQLAPKIEIISIDVTLTSQVSEPDPAILEELQKLEGSLGYFEESSHR